MFSDVHEKRSCTSCVLCNEAHTKYTHPNKWKNPDTFQFLITVQEKFPGCHKVSPDSCICYNCRDSLRNGMKDPDHYSPRWIKKSTEVKCLPECEQMASINTKLVDRNEVVRILGSQPPIESHETRTSEPTPLCETHYRTLHKILQPQNYQWQCSVYMGIRGTKFHSCPNPTFIESHLKQNTNFQGSINSTDKVCLSCYRAHLIILKLAKENPVSTDEELNAHLLSVKK